MHMNSQEFMYNFKALKYSKHAEKKYVSVSVCVCMCVHDYTYNYVRTYG